MKGRATTSNPEGRFESLTTESYDDGWFCEETQKIPTQLFKEKCRNAITYNNSPDIPFDRSINPYRGCEHGCIYCYARPSHSWINLSPGLDFETKLFYKENLISVLNDELCHPHYQCKPIALGVNTDAYQPIDKKLALTRQVLTLMTETNHPVTIVTKSSLIERDLDLLANLAEKKLVSVAVSITTLDVELMRKMEPRANAPHRRLHSIEKLSQAGIPVTVMIAPIIPVLTDHELETILDEAKRAGASSAGYVLLRLPHEVASLFEDWLRQHYPNKTNHVMNVLREMRSGKNNSSTFGERMTGTGLFAKLMKKRFALQCQKLGLVTAPELRTDLFNPAAIAKQLSLF